MNNITVNYKKFRSLVRFRIIILSLLFILLFNFSIGIFNLFPEYVPQGSFEDRSQDGFSNAFNVINTPVERSVNALSILGLKSSDLLFIATPELDIDATEREFLSQKALEGIPMIIMISAKVQALPELNRFISDTLETQVGERIINLGSSTDRTKFETPILHATNIVSGNMSIGNNDTFVPPDNSADTREVFTGTNSFQLLDENGVDFLPLDERVLYFSDSSLINCNGCSDVFAVVIRIRNIIIVADDWMIRNEFVVNHPENLKFLPALLQEFEDIGIPIQRIVVDEAHLDWLVVNHNGLEARLFTLGISLALLVGVLLSAFLVPSFIAIGRKLIRFDKKKETLQGDLYKRLEVIHTEKMIAVPFSLEEKTLLKYMIAQKIKKWDFLNRFATEQLDYIHKFQLTSQISSDLLSNLQILADNYVKSHDAWYIIQQGNLAIENAEKLVETKERLSDKKIQINLDTPLE